MKNLLITLFIFLFSQQFVMAQSNLKRANSLFEKRAYLKAAELYLAEKKKDQEVYEKLGDCYYFNTRMDKAATYYKLLLTNYEESVDATYFYRYSQALKGIEKFDEADFWQDKYYLKKGKPSKQNEKTLAYFHELNKGEKHPFQVHKLNINTGTSEFGGAFFGNVLVFASARGEGDIYDWNNRPYLDLYKAEINESKDLLNVRPFSSSITTKMHESNAIFTKDGNTMYFTRNNFIDGKKGKDSNKISHLKIYKAHLIEGVWADISELPFNSEDYSVEHPALSPDEKKLYFSSDMPGSIGSFDLFVVDVLENGGYGVPKNLGPKINTEFREQFPFVSDSNVLYFASNGHFGLGGLDVFKSKINDDGNVSEAVNLGKDLNSNLDDFAFIIDDETDTGYFSSNRKKGKGDDDIYKFTKKGIYQLYGIALDKNNFKPIPETKVLLADENLDTLAFKTVGDDAKYSFKIEGDKTYTLRGEKELYVPYEITFSTDSIGNIDQNILMLLELYSESTQEIIVKHGKKQIRHDPIYFDLNSSYLRRDAELELNIVVDVMNKYPDIIIICGSHTDSRATDDYNMWLSERRAKRTVDYIISRGISPDRITAKGFGETQIINECTEGVKCHEYQHQQNRRTEFVIVDAITKKEVEIDEELPIIQGKEGGN